MKRVMARVSLAIEFPVGDELEDEQAKHGLTDDEMRKRRRQQIMVLIQRAIHNTPPLQLNDMAITDWYCG